MGIELLAVLIFGAGFYTGYEAKASTELPKQAYEIINVEENK